MKSQAMPVVYDPRVSAGLVGHFAGAISGASIARGVSFLKDRMGEAVFAPGITIIDDPHRLRGLRSKPFDGEGVRNRRMALIENGVLRPGCSTAPARGSWACRRPVMRRAAPAVRPRLRPPISTWSRARWSRRR